MLKKVRAYLLSELMLFSVSPPYTTTLTVETCQERTFQHKMKRIKSQLLTFPPKVFITVMLKIN